MQGIKVVHVEGGLGNQMAAYAVYVAATEANPDDKIYIDTYVYDVKESHSVINMWNGYELNKVFCLELPDIRSLFTPEQIEAQIDYLKKSLFWQNGWNYNNEFINMMKLYGIELQLAYGKVGDTEKNKSVLSRIKTSLKQVLSKSAKTKPEYEIKKLLHLINKKITPDCGVYLLQRREGDYYYDLTLDFMKSKYLQNEIGERVRNGLVFVNNFDKETLEYSARMQREESVSIHVRRTDYLMFNEDCYKYGYFIKAVKHIKSKVKNPVFYIFSDDLEWCKNNLKSIGLSSNDKIIFVDCNRGENNYGDMMLMSQCKHNITTKSSFGWWGSFLNNNPDKITCCQFGLYITEKQF